MLNSRNSFLKFSTEFLHNASKVLKADGSNLFFISSIIESIRKQNIPNYEILFPVEKNSHFLLMKKMLKLYMWIHINLNKLL